MIIISQGTVKNLIISPKFEALHFIDDAFKSNQFYTDRLKKT